MCVFVSTCLLNRGCATLATCSHAVASPSLGSVLPPRLTSLSSAASLTQARLVSHQFPHWTLKFLPSKLSLWYLINMLCFRCSMHYEAVTHLLKHKHKKLCWANIAVNVCVCFVSVSVAAVCSVVLFFFSEIMNHPHDIFIFFQINGPVQIFYWNLYYFLTLFHLCFDSVCIYF